MLDPRLLAPVSVSSTFAGADPVVYMGVEAFPGSGRSGPVFLDVGSTNQWFRVYVSGLTSTLNGMVLYCLYQDAANHVVIRKSNPDPTDTSSDSFEIVKVIGGVETVLAGSGSAPSGLIDVIASADSDYAFADLHGWFFGLGSAAEYAPPVGTGPIAGDLPRGTMIGWDFSGFPSGDTGGAQATFTGVDLGFGDGRTGSGTFHAAMLAQPAILGGWTQAMDDSRWPDALSIWGHRDGGAFRLPFHGPVEGIGASLNRSVGDTGTLRVQSATSDIFVSFGPVQATNNRLTYSTSTFSAYVDYSSSYVAGATLELGAWWETSVDGTALARDVSRGFDGMSISTPDDQFGAWVEANWIFWSMRAKVWINTVLVADNGQNNFVPVESAANGAAELISLSSGDLPWAFVGTSSPLSEAPPTYTGPVYTDFDFRPYTYGPIAYFDSVDTTPYDMIQLSWWQFSELPQHGVSYQFDAHRSQVIAPLVRSSPIVRYVYDFGDGSGQDSTTPLAAHIFVPNQVQRFDSWTVKLTVYNEEGLSDTSTFDLNTSFEDVPNLVGRLGGRRTHFWRPGAE